MAYAFDPNQELIQITGYEFTGFAASGTRVDVSHDDAHYTAHGGNVAGFSASRSRKGTVTMTLVAASRDNRRLTAMYLAQATGAPNGPLVIRRKLDGATKVIAPTCMIERPANVSWGDGEELATWTIVCPTLAILPLGADDATVLTPAEIDDEEGGL